MAEDPFLEQLGAAIRDDERSQASDARWHRLAEGTLSAEERAEIEREAAVDPSVRELLLLYAPLEEVAFARFENEALRGLRAPAARRSSLGLPRAKRFFALAAPLAAAAMLIVWLRAPAPAPLAAYDVVVTTADDASRAIEPSASGPAKQTDRTFELVASPTDAIRGAIEARAFLERDGTVTPWAAPLTISPNGTVRIVGDVDTLFGPHRGAITILLAIGRPGAIPASPTAARGEAENGAWRLVRKEILFGER